jgi:hypothetical protein
MESGREGIADFTLSSGAGSADIGTVPPPVAVDTDKIAVDQHRGLSAEGTIRTVGFQLGIGDIDIL